MRKMVQANLVKNSIAAYFAAIEIHNKPNISYRYETVTLLMMNAWELALKAYVKKYLKNQSIYYDNGNTISFDKALEYVNDSENAKKKGVFSAVKANLLMIEDYRNQVTHFYCDELEPYIFMLVAKAALNYVEFMEKKFKKNIMDMDGLFIMPLGFKLPFRPEDFLSDNVAKYAASEEAKCFINNMVNVLNDLKGQGIEESIVLGFGMYLESVKKISNSDLIAAISHEREGIIFNKNTNVQVSSASSQTVNMSDEDFRRIYPYSYTDLIAWCKANIIDFKQDKVFHRAKRLAEEDENNVYTRKLDNNSPKSVSKKFYSEMGFLAVRRIYCELKSTENQIVSEV